MTLSRSPPKLSLPFSSIRKLASFRLQFGVHLKTTTKRKHIVHLLINPDRTSTLGRVRQLREAATSALGAEAIGTRFELKVPGLVLAPDVELAPKNKVSGDVLEMIASLAHAVDVTFYLPPWTMSPSQA